MSDRQIDIALAERIQIYHAVMRTTIFAFVGIALVLALAPDANALLMTVLVIGVGVYGVLAGNTAIKIAGALSADAAKEAEGSAYAGVLNSTNYDGLRMVSSVVVAAIALAELVAVLT